MSSLAISHDPLDIVPAPAPGAGLYPLTVDRFLVVTPERHTMLSGTGYGRVVEHIDGARSVRQITAAVAPTVSGAVVLFIVERLRRSGWITDGPKKGMDRPDVLAELGLPDDPHSLRRVELLDRTACIADGVDQWVKLDTYLRSSGGRWLPICVDGPRWWVGPTLGAADGPCWRCLRQRLRFNQPVYRWLSRQGRPLPTYMPPNAARLKAFVDAIADSVSAWVDGTCDAFDRLLIEVTPETEHISPHRVVRRPQCPGCGDERLLASRAEQPVVLRSRPVAFAADGGYRIETPETTWERLAHHVSPLTGVVASLGPLPERDHPMRPVFGAVSPVCPFEATPRLGAWRQVSMGKGETPGQARASVLGEAIERYAMHWQGDEACHRAVAAELGDDALGPDALQGFSQRQLARPGALVPGARGPRGVARVPERYDGGPLWWTPVWSLTAGRRRWLPTAWCYPGAPFPDDHRFVTVDSNGRAAGNCIEEAILQGFFELVERDAAAVWWYNRLPRPAVDLAAFDDSRFEDVRSHYESLGWRLWVLDLTHDLGIPTCVALARDDSERWCIGFGSHLDPRLAVSRAISELGQTFDPSPARTNPWPLGALPSTDFLYPAGVTRSLADIPAQAAGDLRDAVELCVERAARAGLETLVLDLSRPDIDLSVALVAVPGLRHFWPRFAPGRLYTVPVEMGWRPTPLTEAWLNPVPLLL